MTRLPPDINESIRAINENLGQNELPVSSSLVAAAFAFAQSGFAEQLLTHYKWAQYPERPSEAFRTLVEPAIVTAVKERHRGQGTYSQYVFDNNPPYSQKASSGRSDDFETKYDLKHHLKTAWTDRSGRIVSELIMHNIGKKPNYTHGIYYEYMRAEDGKIAGYVYAPLKNDGAIDQYVKDFYWEFHNSPVVVDVDYRKTSGRNIAFVTKRVLPSSHIEEINDQAIAETAGKKPLQDGLIYYPKAQGNRQIEPMIDNFGRVRFVDCESIRFEFGEGDRLIIVENDSNWKHLAAMGITSAQVNVVNPRPGRSSVSYIHVPAPLFS